MANWSRRREQTKNGSRAVRSCAPPSLNRLCTKLGWPNHNRCQTRLRTTKLMNEMIGLEVVNGINSSCEPLMKNGV